MNYYYAVVEGKDDKTLQQEIDQYKQAIEAAGGNVHLSKGFSITPATIVLQLPDGIEPGEVFPGYEFEKVMHAERI